MRLPCPRDLWVRDPMDFLGSSVFIILTSRGIQAPARTIVFPIILVTLIPSPQPLRYAKESG